MPYGETYGSMERSLAQAIADELLLRDTSAKKLQQICEYLDIVVDLLSSAITPDGTLKVNSPPNKYILQQHELSRIWTVRSPLQFPKITVYVTQIGANILAQPQEVESSAIFVDEYTVEINFAESCLGFVVIN